MREKRMQVRMRFEKMFDIAKSPQGRDGALAAFLKLSYERNRPATPPWSLELPWRATLLLLSMDSARW